MTVIAALGDVDIDLLVTVDEFPRPGGESFAENAVVSLGGSAANTAAALAFLGFPCAILAQVGDDDFGHRARSLLSGAGIDTGQLLVTDDAPTGMNVVVVARDRERTMLGLPGANRLYPGAKLGDCDWLHLSAYALIQEPQRAAALTALADAHRRGVPVSMDIPSGVARRLREDLVPSLRGAAVVAVGRDSLAQILPGPDPADELLALGVETVAVTDGGRPFLVRRKDETVTMTPPRVKVVDTTGAGDSFVAGLIAGRCWNLDLPPSAALAAVLGVAATLRPGSGAQEWETTDIGGILDGWAEADPAWIEQVRSRLP